jgi:uncharacterized membrane protein YbhN (UPF0104 family)
MGDDRDRGDVAAAGIAADPAIGPAGGWRARLARFERRFTERSGSPRARRWLLAIALVLFVVISVVSFGSLPDDVRWQPWAVLVLLLVTTPLTLAANAAEYRVMGAISRHRIGWLESSRITLIAGAANLLPLPGGIVVRTQALRREGTTYRRALAANAAAGVTWVAVGCLAAGVLLAADAAAVPAVAALLALAVAGLAAVWLLLRRADRGLAGRHLRWLFLVEAATVILSSVRIYVAFQFIGQTLEPVQAVALTASVIIAAAIGIFPAGLGLRELLAGVIGTAVGLTASEAIAATAADRIVSLAGSAILAAVLLGTMRAPAARPDEPTLRPLDVHEQQRT